MSRFPILFSPLTLGDLTLKNRITMAPLYLGYAAPAGEVNPLLLEHYREMAASGASLIVVENASPAPEGAGSPYTLRVDDDRYIEGLARLAETIKAAGARAFLQVNHAGRYTYLPEKYAPSPIQMGRVVYREMSRQDIDRTRASYAAAARRVKAAGFDGVELHGGTGYLLAQFLSPRINKRTDEYGGSLEKRMRFPLEVTEAVKEEVGDFPVGYRFLADEALPDGLRLEETTVFAQELARGGIAYLSVMAGTYDSFFTPHWMKREREEAYMSEYAHAIKKAVPGTPVITAGRIQTPETAECLLAEGAADLIGLARILFADPLWPKKAAEEILEPIVKCEPTCSLCMQRLMVGKPAFCSQWSKERREAFLRRVGEKE